MPHPEVVSALPVCAAKERDHFLSAQPPLPKGTPVQISNSELVETRAQLVSQPWDNIEGVFYAISRLGNGTL